MRSFEKAAAVLLPLMLVAACHQGDQREVERGPQALGDESATPEWEFGYGSLELRLGTAPIEFMMRARAATKEAARALVDSIVRNGTSAPLPKGVRVGRFITADLSGGKLCVHDSVSDELDVFRLAVDESVLADLQSGAGVVVSHPSEGWTTYTACLSPTRVSKGTTVVLATHRKGAPQEPTWTCVLEF